jgi:hypothetical protein
METFNHINHLKYEIETLKTKIKQHDTGHIHTAISVLTERVKELQESISSVKGYQILDSSYPDGDNYWKEIEKRSE